jgi:hypothetical protein
MTMTTRAPNHGHDKVADLDSGDLRSDFDDFTQRFVPDHQMLAARGRRAVFESTDLFVGAADTRFDHAELDLGWTRNFGLRLVNNADLLGRRHNGDGPHRNDLLFSAMLPAVFAGVLEQNPELRV